MPPRAWQALGPLGEQVLWEALQMVADPLRQEEVQRDWPNMNESSMVFLPKLDPGVNGAAGDTRPLNISNGENRVMANAVRYGFERAMKDWISEMQQGFLPNRSMLKNVVDIDHKMQMDSLSGEDGGAMFFDFQAAFPSVVHGFLIDVMEFIGIPNNICTFIKNLYHNNRCNLIVGGDTCEGFLMQSGIRQGCPLSPVIFAVAVDVLLRRARRLLPAATVRAYADDICMAMGDIWAQIPLMQRLMQEFALCSGLELNLLKTVLVPLRVGDPELLRDRLSLAAPAWAPIKIEHSAKCLGFVLGPGRGHTSFNGALRKYKQRVNFWAATGSGTALTLMAYRTYILPVMSFLIQLEGLPPQWEELETWALQKLLPGPFRWCPPYLAKNLKDMGSRRTSRT